MKLFRIALSLLACLPGLNHISAAETTQVKVEPPYWWTGMANDTLQLMITGKGIASAEFNVSYPGVKVNSQLSPGSPNYKLLYLTIDPDTRPGKVKISYQMDGKSHTIDYSLLEREPDAASRKGFDAGDVLYLLMPDRFACGGGDYEAASTSLEYPVAIDRSDPNGRHGGDLKGIRQHLDYLDSLGVTAIWVCPVLENDMPGGSYHGYATTDFYRIDPRFGSNQEWSQLVDEAHKRGMKVVMDMIFNHTGVNHPWMKDLPSADWYNNPDGNEMTNFRLTTLHDPYVSDYDREHTVKGWFVPAMPDLNQNNPHLMKYLTQNSIWWIESAKIDGIRMDTYPYADMLPMAGWADDVMREYPAFNIVGECWYSNEAGSAFWQRGNRLNDIDTKLPSVMDFYYILNGRKAFNDDTDPWHGLNNVYDHLSMDFLYPEPQKVLTFLDNHDSDRFLAEMPDSLGSWKQAMAFLLTSRGIPQIYYGTELLMNGSKEGSDGYIRLDFPGGWQGDSVNAFEPTGRTPIQNEAWDYLSTILNWRRGEARDVMARGSLRHFMPQTGLYVYRRKLDDKEVVVMMNGRDIPLTVTMERTLEILPYGTTLHDIITGQDVTIEPEMTFAPRQVLILQNW